VLEHADVLLAYRLTIDGLHPHHREQNVRCAF
jgi:hypothetical protein